MRRIPTPNEKKTIVTALFNAKVLAEDLVAQERAGLETGLKPGTPAQHLKEANDALNLWGKIA